MKTIERVKARAVRLRNELANADIIVSHSESLELISKLEGYNDWNTHIADLTKRQEIAERYLDEAIEAGKHMDFASFTQRFETKYIPGFTEKNFKRQMKYMKEEFGAYKRREHIGTVKGEAESDRKERYPDATKHIWRGEYENAVMFISVGVYFKNGNYHLSDIHHRNM